MPDDALCWRVEAVCRAAWPAQEEIERGDWRLRFAAGHSRRANSINSIRYTGGDIGPIIDWAEAEFAARDLAPVFRLPDLIDPLVAEQLAARGYRRTTANRTLYTDLFPMPMRRDPDVVILARPDNAWFAAMGRLQQWDASRLARYGDIVSGIAVPAGFMTLALDGTNAAMAFAAIHDGIVCLESVVVDPDQRRHGHGARLIGAALAWAIGMDARGACLQVDAGNLPALSFYRRMGFIRDLYSYDYWTGSPVHSEAGTFQNQ